MEKYTPPKFMEKRFNCPHCNAFSQHDWEATYTEKIGVGYEQMNVLFDPQETEVFISKCLACEKNSIWRRAQMFKKSNDVFYEYILYPKISNAPLAIKDMPEDVKNDYNEARNIVSDSPRGAAALLRLALQKLMPHLGESGENLNSDIASLVKKGLPSLVQKILDSIRVIGNESVHPGELDMRDDLETATKLFRLLNLIVEKMIVEPKQLNDIYETKVPDSKKKQIEARDKKS